MTWLLAALGGAALFSFATSSASPVDLAVGAAAGLGLATLAGSRRWPVVYLARVAWSPLLAFGTALEVGAATVRVMATIVGLRAPREDGIVEMPIGERSNAGILVTSLVASMSPGAMLLSIDHDRGVLVFHLLDATDPDAFRASQDRFYRRYQRRVIP